MGGPWEAGGGQQQALPSLRPMSHLADKVGHGRLGLLGNSHPGGPSGREEVWQQFLSTKKRPLAQAPRHGHYQVHDSRLHSCGCCLEAEEVFLGEPGTDGGVICKTKEVARVAWGFLKPLPPPAREGDASAKASGGKAAGSPNPLPGGWMLAWGCRVTCLLSGSRQDSSAAL